MTSHAIAPREVLTLAPRQYAGQAATLIGDTIVAAVATRGRCRLVLAGGRTPAAIYRILATRADLPWATVEVFIGDERCVPQDDIDSNFRMIVETLLSEVPIPAANTHRLHGEAGATQAAAEYHQILNAIPAPKFDLVLSGVGADGHTASLFPGDPRVETEERWAMPAVAPSEFAVAERVGLSLRALNSTRIQVVLCTGQDKQPVRQRILANAPDAVSLPAARLHGTERTIWIIDPD